MVTAVICMLLRRHVLKICFKVAEYRVIDFRGTRFEVFQEHASCNAAGLLIQSSGQAQYVPS